MGAGCLHIFNGMNFLSFRYRMSVLSLVLGSFYNSLKLFAALCLACSICIGLRILNGSILRGSIFGVLSTQSTQVLLKMGTCILCSVLRLLLLDRCVLSCRLFVIAQERGGSGLSSLSNRGFIFFNVLGLSYLMVAHDLAVIRHASDRVAVMYLGRIVEIGDVDQVFDNPIHPYTRALLSAIPVPDPEVEAKRHRIMLEGDLPTPVNAPKGCGFSSRCPVFKLLPEDKKRRCLEEMPELTPVEGQDHGYACYYPEAEAAVKKIKLFSTAALIVGVLGLFFYLYVGFIGAAAIGAGVVALTLNKGYESRGLAIAGILLGAAGISMWAFSLYMSSSF